ncbi:hypothetical protein JTY60_00290 [symbiont of Argiope bruennichi]|uniref:HisA/HisF-related TIM barrel protein n=1 Tax=symbiont of Argiope bruennichi TaxID=2810479 RepID=UPI003DA1F30D
MSQKINFFNLLKTYPVFNSSGCGGSGFDFFFEPENNILDIFVTKTVTLDQKIATNQKKCVILENNLFINRIGLINPGILNFSKELNLFNRKYPSKKLIVSLFFNSVEEVAPMFEILENFDFVIGYELNLSCPNTNEIIIEDKKKILKEILFAVKKQTKKLLFPKISIFSKNFFSNIRKIDQLKFDGVVITNTAPATCYLWENNRLTQINGGLSGDFIKPILIKKILQVREKHNIPIFSCGGVKNFKDVLEYLVAGANYVQIGTNNFKDPAIVSKIVKEINNFFEKNNFSSILDFLEQTKITKE